MKCRLLTIFAIFLTFAVNAQQQNLAVVDSFKTELAKAKTSEQKVEVAGMLSMTLMNTSKEESDKYGALMTQEAELSRNRQLMARALMVNGLRYSFFTGNREYLQKSLDYLNKGLDLSRKNKLEKETAEFLLTISGLYSSIPELDKAMNYATQALAIASDLKNDSLRVATYYSFGSIFQLKKERILALRNYLTALRIAEEAKDALLLRNCYYTLSQFYVDIKEYDKAIDYLQKSTEQLKLAKNIPNKEYTSVVDLYMMGDLYMQKKDFDMSLFYYDSSIRRADEIKYYPLKMPGYRGILRQYIQAKQPDKALAYLNSRQDLRAYVANFGASHVMDHSYAAIYTQLGKYDSARVYFGKAAPGFEASTPAARLSFYYQYADFFNKAGDQANSLNYYGKAMDIATTLKDLEWQQRIAKEMDSVYTTTGDFKQARFYSNQYYQFKDSLQKLSEEKDLLQMELADEQIRQERIRKEEAAALERKHTVQYTGISIAIGLVFILLVAMGIFRVSETTIKIMGFFSFILLFEFIILIADTKIHHMTHGEPLPILAIKIVLIAMLLPLHHWLEHKVVHYLTSRRLIIPARKSIWHTLTLRKKPATEATHNINHPH
ncbi:MAG TPA: tetratricopeptide repeat protein [Flavisolibacter sp.]|nr:tetratricopeptide repeat protein [Flavisolibacter sp.]